MSTRASCWPSGSLPLPSSRSMFRAAGCDGRATGRPPTAPPPSRALPPTLKPDRCRTSGRGCGATAAAIAPGVGVNVVLHSRPGRATSSSVNPLRGTSVLLTTGGVKKNLHFACPSSTAGSRGDHGHSAADETAYKSKPWSCMGLPTMVLTLCPALQLGARKMVSYAAASLAVAASLLLSLQLPPALAANEFLSQCTSAQTVGGQSTVPQRVLFVEIGGAETNAPSPATSSCTTSVAAAKTALATYLNGAGRGDVVTYFPLNDRSAVPDLNTTDQVWVRGN